MNIKGIQKTSLVDYPDKISTVLFFGGCNLRCRFCHNPELVFNKDSESHSFQFAFDLIKARLQIIDGIVITGGEPTLQTDIDLLLFEIKKISLPVKIDTNGLNPDIIKKLLDEELIDYLAIDIKTSPEKYESLTGVNTDFNDIVKTIDLAKESGIDYELRTTCIPDFISIPDLEKIKAGTGHVKRYYLQQFINKNTLDPSMRDTIPYSPADLKELKEFVQTFSDICEIRGI